MQGRVGIGRDFLLVDEQTEAIALVERALGSDGIVAEEYRRFLEGVRFCCSCHDCIVFIVIGCKSTHFFLNKLQSHEKSFNV